jgi:hypothetical protein
MRKPQKASAASAKKKPFKTPVKAVKNAIKVKVSPVVEETSQCPFEAKGIDPKIIREACDFKSPIAEWAIPMLRQKIESSECVPSNFQSISPFSIVSEMLGKDEGRVVAAFGKAFESLHDFIRRGNFKTGAKLTLMVLGSVSAEIKAWEAFYPEFGQLNVMDWLLKHFAKEAERKRRTPLRAVVYDKSKYRESCQKEIEKVVILHRAGWRKHWVAGAKMPEKKFGSIDGRKEWEQWMRYHLYVLHNNGDLAANPKSKFSKEGKAKDRSKDRDKFFDELYLKASSEGFCSCINIYESELNLHAYLKSYPEGFSFLTMMAMEHSECAPDSFVHKRIKFPEGLC